MLKHFVTVEIMRRGLDIKTAISETANAFGAPVIDISWLVLAGTGFAPADLPELEQVYTGELLPGDLSLNASAGTDRSTTPGAFDVIKKSGDVRIEQCHLILRRSETENDCADCGERGALTGHMDCPYPQNHF